MAPLPRADASNTCTPGAAGLLGPEALEEAHLPAFSWIARLQYDRGPGGDGGGGGSQALLLLLDEMVTERPCLQDRNQKGQVGKYSDG